MKPKIHTLTAGYFPNAIEAVARHAQYGNDKHNPGEPLHWAFHKSTEHLESAARHLVAPESIDPETGRIHLIGAAMRILMALETALIKNGATPGFAVDMVAPEQPEPKPDPERWGVFVGEHLIHGQITFLGSERAAISCPQFNQHDREYRVAPIELNENGFWREKKS